MLLTGLPFPGKQSSGTAGKMLGLMLPCRDEESPYLSAKGPASGGPPTAGQRVWRELKTNWWLWASIVFAVVLVSGLLLFRNQLYDTATHGLPFLAGAPHALCDRRFSLSEAALGLPDGSPQHMPTYLMTPFPVVQSRRTPPKHAARHARRIRRAAWRWPLGR